MLLEDVACRNVRILYVMLSSSQCRYMIARHGSHVLAVAKLARNSHSCSGLQHAFQCLQWVQLEALERKAC